MTAELTTGQEELQQAEDRDDLVERMFNEARKNRIRMIESEEHYWTAKSFRIIKGPEVMKLHLGNMFDAKILARYIGQCEGFDCGLKAGLRLALDMIEDGFVNLGKDMS